MSRTTRRDLARECRAPSCALAAPQTSPATREKPGRHSRQILAVALFAVVVVLVGSADVVPEAIPRFAGRGEGDGHGRAGATIGAAFEIRKTAHHHPHGKHRLALRAQHADAQEGPYTSSFLAEYEQSAAADVDAAAEKASLRVGQVHANVDGVAPRGSPFAGIRNGILRAH